jgi:hypothetical protein
MTPSGVQKLRKRGVWSQRVSMQLLGNEALPVQMLCFDHALAYVELFFPGNREVWACRYGWCDASGGVSEQ